MKKILKKNTYLNILVFFIITSCSVPNVKLEAPQINNLVINKSYRINLPEDHSSGYIWHLDENYDKKIMDHINTVWHGNKKGVDYNFNTLTIGQTTLTFVARKYTDTSDIKHFIVNIGPK